MKRFLFILTLLLFSPGACLLAQLSEGGIPRSAAVLKSAPLKEVRMPFVSNDMLRWQHQPPEEGLLKPLTFAHSFQVNISPLLHGNWSRSSDGWWIWQVTISSQGAFSLNLLFEKITLPPGARLFLFSPDQSKIIGAFTARTISESTLFATEPLEGESLVVQYEIPAPPGKDPDFVISTVNHDFLGILKYTDIRRPMGITAGDCNTDIRCKAGDKWNPLDNSVCRVMILGKELCTGTLMNNTAQDKKPYILTANHCINTPLKAAGTLFLFNYESPYCGSIDGDVTNSLSGSRLKATFDSLDFSLVELTTPPPPALRPYYAGWNRGLTPSDTMACIHHPQGDIKKIAIDYEKPVKSTFLSSFVNGAFWKILRWEYGTTEIGSSGGPLFNKSGQLTGTLSGGAAACGNPVDDYFARFDLAWNYKSDSARQLKHWLDPVGTNPQSFSGKQYNSGEQFCSVFNHLMADDVHQLVKTGNPSGGWWSGTNKDGITEIAEKFKLSGGEKLQGVYLGVGKKFQANSANNSYITLRVYNLKGNSPVFLAEKDSVLLKNLASNAMNYIRFNTPPTPADSFLIAVTLGNVRQGDSLILYQTLRPAGSLNTFWMKRNESWVRFPEVEPSKKSGSLVMEILACNVGGPQTDTVYYNQKFPVLVWPNPAVSRFSIQTADDFEVDRVAVYNLRGQMIRCEIIRKYPRHLEFNLSGHPSGIYLIRLENGGKIETAKVMLVSQ